MSSTIQCHSCYKHMPVGLKFCICGICLRPDEDTIRKIEARLKTLIVPHYVARINRSTSNKCGESQWQRYHWKAKDATRAASKSGKSTITIRWQDDEQYRESQKAHGWTEEYCKYLDYLKTIDVILTTRPCAQRHRYDSTITVAMTAKYRQCGPMNRRRSDYIPTTNALIGL